MEGISKKLLASRVAELLDVKVVDDVSCHCTVIGVVYSLGLRVREL